MNIHIVHNRKLRICSIKFFSNKINHRLCEFPAGSSMSFQSKCLMQHSYHNL